MLLKNPIAVKMEKLSPKLPNKLSAVSKLCSEYQAHRAKKNERIAHMHFMMRFENGSHFLTPSWISERALE